MFAAAASLVFYGLVTALLVDPTVGMAVVGLGVCCLFWRVFAALALPLLGLGALWAKARQKRQQERLAA